MAVDLGSTFKDLIDEINSKSPLGNYVTKDTAQEITGSKTFKGTHKFTGETQFTHSSYAPTFVDIANGIGKSSCFTRGAFMQAIIGQIIAPNANHTDNSKGYSIEKDRIKFQRVTSVVSGQPTLSEMASIDKDGIKENGEYLNKKYALKTELPTVNNGTLTISVNNKNPIKFTANSNTDVAVNVPVPTKTSDLENDSGFINKHQDISGKTNTSVMPNDGGDIKTKFRMSHKDYTSGEQWYFPICKFPTDDAGNYASAIVSGRIGGWQSGNLSYINALVWNRDTTDIALMDIAGSASTMKPIWDRADLVIYDNSDNSSTLYVKCNNYYTFDLDLELYQSGATILYDGSHINTTPSGTLMAQSSQSTKRVEIVNGKVLVNGTEMAKKSDIPNIVIDDKFVANSTNPVQSKVVQQGIADTLSTAKTYTETKIAELVGSAPETLDTLQEVAKAIQDNEEVVTSLEKAIGEKANRSGDDFTGKITAPQIETGTADSNYFQSRKFRGEGNADTYYHAIDFGYANNNKFEFHEYGGTYNFYKNENGKKDTGVLVGAFTPSGIKEGDKLLSEKYASKGDYATKSEIGNATININVNGSNAGSFTTNQKTNGDINITTPTVNNGKLTISKNGTSVATFTANQSGDVQANITVPTKTSELTNDSNFLTSHQDISGKLDKTTYEFNKELALGSNGKVCLGKFSMYDTNLTIEISSTTSKTYSGKLVLATQNIDNAHGGSYSANVYGDATGTLSDALTIIYPSNSRIFEIYCNFTGWSKNLIHIQAVNLQAQPTNVAVVQETDIPTANKIPINNVLRDTFVPTTRTINKKALSGNVTLTQDDIGEGTTYTQFSKTNKTKLDGIADGANKTVVDSSLSTTSTNPVRNSVVTNALNNRLTKADNSGISVLGKSKSTTTLGGYQLYAPNGIIFGGTALDAGLVTRGICGIKTPTDGGACEKDNLYINYDGNNDFNSTRQVVVNAGSIGNHLGNNMYQYTLPRGDIVKNWVEAQGFLKSHQDISGKANLAGGNVFSGVQTFADTIQLKAGSPNIGSNGIRWDANSLPQDSAPKYICTIDAFANGGRQKWATIENLKSVLGIPTDYVTINTNQDITGNKTFKAPTNVSNTEQITSWFETANGGRVGFGKEKANSGTGIFFDQVKGTRRLNFRASSTAGAMVWEQPEQGAQLYFDIGKEGIDKKRISLPSKAGTLAVTSEIPSKTSQLTNDSGYLTAHQDISGKANLSGGNDFTGKQVFKSPPSDGYSIQADGYIKGSWLQAPLTGHKNESSTKVAILDGSGWIYYRTPQEIISDGGGVKQVKINGTTKSPDSNGLVDLGTVGGGGSSGKYLHAITLYWEEVTNYNQSYGTVTFNIVNTTSSVYQSAGWAVAALGTIVTPASGTMHTKHIAGDDQNDDIDEQTLWISGINTSYIFGISSTGNRTSLPINDSYYNCVNSSRMYKYETVEAL